MARLIARWVALYAIASTATLALPWANSKFKYSKLYDISPLVGLGDVDGTIAAFGDWNADKNTDLFVLSADQSTVTVHNWDPAKWSFVKSNTARIFIPGNEFVITNVIPGDFNHDGKLDVMLMGQADPQNKPDGELFMRVYLGTANDTLDPNFIKLPSSSAAQPILFDYDGNMRTDLLGYPSSSSDTLSVWRNVVNPATNALEFEIAPFPLNNSAPACKPANPHSSAFVDLDGDCLADLFLVCQEEGGRHSYQIWINSVENGFVFKQTGQLPAGAGQISFADMDGDGTIDVVFPVCDGDHCSIHTVYNQQLPLCPASVRSTAENCRSVENMCIADPEFRLKFEYTAEEESYVVSPLKDVVPGKVLMTDTSFKGVLPVPVRIGDYDLDGYPDLLVVSDAGSKSQVSLLRSVPCSEQVCTPSATANNRRAFTRVTEGVEELEKITNARAATFLDIDEDGTLDIIVLGGKPNSNTAAREIHVIHNNFFNDAFFLKTLALNGVCPGWCSLEKFPVQKPFGVSYPGSSFKFTVLDTAGNKRANQIAQLPQASYMALHTPYTLFGLGRTNNYVEKLFIGVTLKQSQHYTSYSGVIPNSQLIINPYQPPGSKDPESWILELYIRPGEYVPWVLVTLVSATVLLGIVVAVLNWMEKREDELERRKALHIINFDAL
ncbi:uncharacterized protein VTP21DRAFT_6822 [Calcarisporiella thermophila]|uniref:uncharacterized protein n=1 Tax=Calcarisporiella thermophila TaxID=911321 RepID=UPI003742CA64